jgi:phosphoribosylformimino-5-aminoimidazole carboxamide ribotide isomerase
MQQQEHSGCMSTLRPQDGSSGQLELLPWLLESPQSVQTGGGAAEDISKRLEHGASRVVVVACVTQTQSFLGWLEEFGADCIVSALDVEFDAAGTPWPRIHGWTVASERNLWDLLDVFCAHGLKHLLCTDISKDGALGGPNLALYSTLVERYPELEIQASGGVSGLRDLERWGTVAAAITGKPCWKGVSQSRKPELLASNAKNMSQAMPRRSATHRSCLDVRDGQVVKGALRSPRSATSNRRHGTAMKAPTNWCSRHHRKPGRTQC